MLFLKHRRDLTDSLTNNLKVSHYGVNSLLIGLESDYRYTVYIPLDLFD